MIHYSIIPPEYLFSSSDMAVPKTFLVQGDRFCLEVQVEGQDYRVLRLLSTDPEHYLQPALQPGVMLGKEHIVTERGSRS